MLLLLLLLLLWCGALAFVSCCWQQLCLIC
jgi:hypothetical protein